MLAIDLSSLQVTNFVKPGVNVPVEIEAEPDRLRQGRTTWPRARMGASGSSRTTARRTSGWHRAAAARRTSVDLFASLTDPGAEGTGIYFGKDPKTLFVNVQHSSAPNGDGTWAISAR